jgi:hypothetical protein
MISLIYLKPLGNIIDVHFEGISGTTLSKRIGRNPEYGV